MKLLIRNLSRTTTEAELRELFESYGPVQSCTLVMDSKAGASKGFGFIEMPRPGDAKAAMKNLNGKEVDGNKIRVKKAEPMPDTGSRPNTTSDDQINYTRSAHGITLKMILTRLVEQYGWEDLGHRVTIKCFTNDPSITSSLKFLRKTPWARDKVEALYLKTNRSTNNIWTSSRNKPKE